MLIDCNIIHCGIPQENNAPVYVYDLEHNVISIRGRADNTNSPYFLRVNQELVEGKRSRATAPKSPDMRCNELERTQHSQQKMPKLEDTKKISMQLIFMLNGVYCWKNLTYDRRVGRGGHALNTYVCQPAQRAVNIFTIVAIRTARENRTSFRISQKDGDNYA